MDFIDRFNTIFLRTYTYRILDNFLELATELLPYICLGIILVAVLQRFVPRLTELSFLGSASPLSICLSALAGSLAPLPVYLAVPFAAVLISTGFPAAVVVAFLVACPLVDPNLFILTLGSFGPAMAVARLTAALLLGTGAGLLYKNLERRFKLSPPDHLSEKATDPAAQKISRPIALSLRRQSWFILKIFTVSLLITAAIKALVPPELMRALFAGTDNTAILLAIALGVPFYQCGGASIPIMQALNELGLNNGAVLAFFISGPATKISALYAFREGFGNKAVMVYLVYTLTGAFVAGIVFNLFF